MANIIANVVGAQFIRKEHPDDPDPYYFLFCIFSFEIIDNKQEVDE